jgi:hypothetical protein
MGKNIFLGGTYMNTSEELAGVAVSSLKDLIKKAMDVIQELLKALILRGTQQTQGIDDDRAKAGKNKIEKLLSGGNRLNTPIMLDKQDVKRFYKLAKKHQIPVAVIKGKDGCRAFFRESDLGRVSEMMKEMMMNKTAAKENVTEQDNAAEKEKYKEIILENKQDAKYFQSRAAKEKIHVTFFDTKDGKVKVAFKESDLDKVINIMNDLNQEKTKIPRRKMTIDTIKDQTRAAFTGKAVLRIYDMDLNRSIRMDLPITKKAFIKNVKAALGYSDKEAKDLASRLETGKGIEGYVVGMDAEKWKWKEDYKEQFSQLNKMVKDIKFSNEPDSLKNYSFSSVTLADGKNTQVITVLDKEYDKSFSTQPVDKSTFVKEVKERLGVNDITAQDMLHKAAKLGFITDMEKDISKNKGLSVSRDDKTKEFVYKLGDKEYRSKNETKEAVISGLQKNLSLNEKQANAAWAKGNKLAMSYKDNPTFEGYQINKSSANNTVTFAYDGKTFKADLSKKDNSIAGLQKTFGLSEKESISLYTKADKQGVKDVVKSATKKTEINKQKTTITKDKTIKKEQSAGAR